MDRGEAFSTFQECVAEVLDIELAARGGPFSDARWREDLDADSLAVVEITLALNDAFSIKIPDVDPEQLITVGRIVSPSWPTSSASRAAVAGPPAGGR